MFIAGVGQLFHYVLHDMACLLLVSASYFIMFYTTWHVYCWCVGHLFHYVLHDMACLLLVSANYFIMFYMTWHVYCWCVGHLFHYVLHDMACLLLVSASYFIMFYMTWHVYCWCQPVISSIKSCDYTVPLSISAYRKMPRIRSEEETRKSRRYSIGSSEKRNKRGAPGNLPPTTEHPETREEPRYSPVVVGRYLFLLYDQCDFSCGYPHVCTSVSIYGIMLIYFISHHQIMFLKLLCIFTHLV